MTDIKSLNESLIAAYRDSLTEEEIADPDLAYHLVRSVGWAADARKHLQDFKPEVYETMKTAGTLTEYLANIELQARSMEDNLIPQYQERFGVTEKLKAEDQMKWVGLMENIMASIREVIRETLIHV